MNYHVYLGAGYLDSFPLPFRQDEFFPLGMHQFVPLMDAANVLLARTLGYRFGTIASLVTVLLIIFLVSGLVRRLLPNTVSLGLALVLIPLFLGVSIVNEAAFQVATYFTDNAYALLSLVQVLIIVRLVQVPSSFNTLQLILFALLVALSLTKLTNAVFQIPLMLTFLFIVWRSPVQRQVPGRERLTRWLRLVLLLCFTTVVTAIVNYTWALSYLQTGNPVFPYYNGFFASPLAPEESWTFNFGPKTLLERLIFPVYAIADPSLLGEVKDLFPDVRLVVLPMVLALLLACLKFAKVQAPAPLNVLCIIFFSSFLLWQMLFGYTRYAIYLEFLAGVVLMAGASMLWMTGREFWRVVVSVVIVAPALLLATAYVLFNFRYDISWRPNTSLAQSVSLLGEEEMWDRQMSLEGEAQAYLQEADFWLQCGNPSSAYRSLVEGSERLPLVNFDRGSNGMLTTNPLFVAERDARLIHGVSPLESRPLRFITVVNLEGGPAPTLAFDRCISLFETLGSEGVPITLDDSVAIDNFIGDSTRRSILMVGTYTPTYAAIAPSSGTGD